MSFEVRSQPISATAFAPFGDLISTDGAPDMLINQGLCGRFHDLAKLDFGEGRAGISLFDAVPRTLPYQLKLVERHPWGSQCFIPMSAHGFLVIVAADTAGVPGVPRAFRTQSGQAVNFHCSTWHGVLTPLQAPGLFAVVDRIGSDANLEEYHYPTAYNIVS